MAFWIHRAAGLHPDRVALEGPERTLTYRQLADEAVDGLGALRALGLDRGDRPVALELPPGEAYVVALHACLLRVVPVVPIDLRLSEAERAVRRARAGAVIAEPLAPGRWRGRRRFPDGTEGARPLAPESDCAVVDLGSRTSIHALTTARPTRRPSRCGRATPL